MNKSPVEEFAEVVLSDPTPLRNEFYDIIAAEWPTPRRPRTASVTCADRFRLESAAHPRHRPKLLQPAFRRPGAETGVHPRSPPAVGRRDPMLINT